MFNFPYVVEILSPKVDSGEKMDTLLKRFGERYEFSISAGCGISVPDNPMGQKRISLLDCLEECGVKVEPDKIIMNLNTFHGKEELDSILKRALKQGIDKLLVIRGDGGPGLEKLDPRTIGGQHNVATTPDLLRYINSEYTGHFNTGVAFNPYKNMDFELKHMQKKVNAGVQFVITQPIVGKDKNVDTILKQFNIPVIIEAWMSKNIELFYKSVGKEEDVNMIEYDPEANLTSLHKAYPQSCIYLALLSFASDWRKTLPRLTVS